MVSKIDNIETNNFSLDKEMHYYLNNLCLSSGSIENFKVELKKITPFSSCLKIFRAKKGISQKELAESVGITETSIYNYENAKSNPTKNNKLKIMRFLEISDIDLEKSEKILLFYRSEYELKNKENIESEKILDRIKEDFSDFSSLDRIRKDLAISNPSISVSVTYSETIFKDIILPMILKRKDFSLKDLENTILGFKMLKGNKNYEFELISDKFINNHYVDFKILFFDKRNETDFKEYQILEFVDLILIPLAESLDNIFKSSKKIDDRKLNKQDKQLSKQYDVLNDFFKENVIDFESNIDEIYLQIKRLNKEGGSDE